VEKIKRGKRAGFANNATATGNAGILPTLCLEIYEGEATRSK